MSVLPEKTPRLFGKSTIIILAWILKSMSHKFFFVFILFTYIFLTGCETTLYVRKGDRLLNNNPTIKGNLTMNKELLQEGIKTKANRRVLGIKVYLIAWNLGNYLAREKHEKWRKYYRWFDKNERYLNAFAWSLIKIIGEPPVLIDTLALKDDCKNLTNILQANGYLNAKVSYHIEKISSKVKLINGVEKLIINPKLANVHYYVEENEPYLIRNIVWDCEDIRIKKIIEEHQESSLLQKGKIYQESLLEKERVRVANLLRNEGFYKFSPGLIAYEVDTTQQNVNQTFQNVLRRTSFVPTPRTPLFADITVFIDDQNQNIYHIERVNIFLKSSSSTPNDDKVYLQNPMDLDSRKLFKLPQRFFSDNLQAKYLVPLQDIKLFNYNFLENQITLKKNEVYQLKEVQITQQRLQNLGIFRNIAITFEIKDSTRTLIPNIDLTIVQRNSFQTGFEVFQSENRNLNANLPGIGGRLTYLHRNLLKKADKLEISLSGNLNFYYPDSASDPRIFFQFLPKASLIFPRILFLEKLFKKPYEIRPSTRLSFNYAQENRIEFNRTSIGLNYSYQWFSRKSNRFRYQWTILDFNQIDSKNLSQGFIAQIEKLPPTTQQIVIRDFTPRYNSKTGLRIFYYNYLKGQKKPGIASIFNMEIGGNIPYLLERLYFSRNQDSSLTDGYVSNQFLYGQFYKIYHDTKYYFPTTRTGVLVFRMMQGIALGFNRTKIVPFENRFFMGGINSVRGWQSNTLGPGTFVKSENNLLVYGGEIAFEANIELRQKLYKYIEFAIFGDAGNVWFSKSGGFGASEGKFATQNLKLGIAGGIGIRFDFQFLIIRLDLGQQLYDPSRQKWIFKSYKDIGAKNLQYNLGIGYPF